MVRPRRVVKRRTQGRRRDGDQSFRCLSLRRFGMRCGGAGLRRWGLSTRRVAGLPRSPVSPDQFAKSFATPRQTRAHRADWHTEDLRDTLVVHPFKADEQENLAVLGRKLGKRLIELDQLPPRRRIGGSHYGRGYALDVDRRRFTRLPPHRIDVLMVHNLSLIHI